MRGHRASGTKTLRLAKPGIGVPTLAGGENGRFHVLFEQVGIAGDPGVDNQIDFFGPAIRRQRQFGAAVVANEIGDAEKSLP